MRRRHRLVACAVAFGAVAAPAAPVAADAAGPGDYRTEIERIVPAVGTVRASVHGGDSFLRLEVATGTVVTVPGYRDEPFLEFAADGTVRENVAGVTHLLSRDRYGGTLPEGFDESAVEWRVVATDGSYAWHDHRIHWMSDVRPPGHRPGDVILRATVPIVVDGVAVSIEVRSVWLPAPSRWPVWLGLVVGAALAVVGALGLLVRRQVLVAVGSALVAATLSTAVGVWQYRSLPSDTGPQSAWWWLPATAFAAAVAAAVPARRGVVARLASVALVAAGGVLLTVWAWPRREGWAAALQVGSAPGWLDRSVSAGTLVVGAGLAVVALAALGAVVAAPGRSLATSGEDVTSGS